MNTRPRGRMDLTCFGELILDLFASDTGKPIDQVSEFIPAPGGAASNVAVQASRLGLRTAFIGKVGNDTFGHFLAGVLKKEGVQIGGMRFDPSVRTTLNFIAIPDPDQAEFLFYRNPGADMNLFPEELDGGIIQRSRCLYFGSLALTAEPVKSTLLQCLTAARDAGCLIVFDVNYRNPLWVSAASARSVIEGVLPYVDVIKVNQQELEILTNSMGSMEVSCSNLIHKGIHLVVLTLGRKGSYFQTASSSSIVAAFNVETVDASGCGDSFTAGLIHKLLQGDRWMDNLTLERLEQALQFANACGAITSMKKGVIPSLPGLQQVEEFLAAHIK